LRLRDPFVFRTEPESLATLGQRIEVGSVVHADEAAHWDALHSRYLTMRINHQEAYSADGACTNDAESFFSRLRRSEIGIHHHIAGPYLHLYASEMAWREDNRRRSNGEQYLITANAALAHPVSRQWKGLLATRYNLTFHSPETRGAPMFNRRILLQGVGSLACAWPYGRGYAEDGGESAPQLKMPEISNSEK
jgi:hypothetical protein